MPYLYHSYQSPKSDSADSSLVRPSNWNAKLRYSNFATSGPGTTDAIVREVLTASRTYFVRSDGSDSNDGLTNTAGGAFLTIQHAYDVIQQTLDVAGVVGGVNISLQAGATFGGFTMNWPWVGGGDITLTGNNCTMSASFGACIHNSCFMPGIFQFSGITFTTTGSNVPAILFDGGGHMEILGGCVFGTCSGPHVWVSGSGVHIFNGQNYTISGNATYHCRAEDEAQYTISSGSTITLSGTPAFSSAFAYADDLSYINTTGTTFSGSATGVRFNVSNGAKILTGTNSLTALPGNADGVIGDGGQYDNLLNIGIATSNETMAANTSADGVILLDSTPATSGNQQYSPRLRLTGQGWQTATSSSQQVDWIVENKPVQGTTNPGTALAISAQVNGGGYSEVARFLSGVAGTGPKSLWINADGDPSTDSPFVVGVDITVSDACNWAAYGNGAGACNYIISKTRGATPATHVILQSSDKIGSFFYQSSDGTAYVNSARIQCIVDGTPAAGAVPGRWVFGVATAAGTMVDRLGIRSAGPVNILNNSGLTTASSALSTSATDGFLYIPTCAGAPSGTPTAQPGTVAMVYDTTNNRLLIYNSSWKGTTTPGTWT